jgi:hypothetical protein
MILPQSWLKPVQGRACASIAVSADAGAPFTDCSMCVPRADSWFLRILNESTAWPSGETRTDTLMQIVEAAMAATEPREAWAAALAAQITRKIVPLVMLRAADTVPAHAIPTHGLRAAAQACADAGTKETAWEAATVARGVADAVLARMPPAPPPHRSDRPPDPAYTAAQDAAYVACNAYVAGYYAQHHALTSAGAASHAVCYYISYGVERKGWDAAVRTALEVVRAAYAATSKEPTP